MGRKGGLSPIADLTGKALKKRKATGAGLRATQGRQPGESFLGSFARSRGGREKLEQEQATRQEQARGRLRERFQGRDTRGSILERLFGQALDGRG